MDLIHDFTPVAFAVKIGHPVTWCMPNNDDDDVTCKSLCPLVIQCFDTVDEGEEGHSTCKKAHFRTPC